jgi:hypothetical protein
MSAARIVTSCWDCRRRPRCAFRNLRYMLAVTQLSVAWIWAEQGDAMNDSWLIVTIFALFVLQWLWLLNDRGRSNRRSRARWRLVS